MLVLGRTLLFLPVATFGPKPCPARVLWRAIALSWLVELFLGRALVMTERTEKQLEGRLGFRNVCGACVGLVRVRRRHNEIAVHVGRNQLSDRSLC